MSDPTGPAPCLDAFDDDQLEEIISFLQLAPHKRNLDDLNKIYSMLGKLDFFKDLWSKLSHKAAISLIKQMKHEYAEKSKPIFSYGELALKFYIILQGSVYIIAPKQTNKKFKGRKVVENVESKTRSQLKRISTIHLSRQKTLIEKIEEEISAAPEEILLKYPNHFVLNTLNQGDHFGEASLNMGTSRIATVVSRESSHLITLNSAFYNQIMGKYKERVEKESLEFFQEAPVTKNWPPENIASLAYVSKLVEFQRNQIVYDIGDSCDYIYFIKEGEVEILKEASLNKTEDEGSQLTAQPKNSLNIEKAKLTHVNSIWKKQFSKAKVQQIKVALLGKYQVFGNEEFSEMSETRLAKAIVKSSKADIYVVSYIKFIENKNNPRELCLDLLNINKVPKNEWRESFGQNLLRTRLSSDESPEKTKSKFSQEPSEGLPTLNRHTENFSERSMEEDRSNKFYLSFRKFPNALNETFSPRNTVKSLSPKATDFAVPALPTLPLKGALRDKFVELINPESKEVKVVFNSNNKIAIEPSFVSVCLDLSPHSLQGTKVYQTQPLMTIPEDTFTNKMLKTSETAPDLNKYNITLTPFDQDLFEQGEESALFTSKAMQDSFTTTANHQKPGIDKSEDSVFNRKLEERIGLKKVRSYKSHIDSSTPGICITSMFMNNNAYTRPIEKVSNKNLMREHLSPLSKRKVTKNQSLSSETYYTPILYLPHSLPQKRPPIGLTKR